MNRYSLKKMSIESDAQIMSMGDQELSNIHYKRECKTRGAILGELLSGEFKHRVHISGVPALDRVIQLRTREIYEIDGGSGPLKTAILIKIAMGMRKQGKSVILVKIGKLGEQYETTECIQVDYENLETLEGRISEMMDETVDAILIDGLGFDFNYRNIMDYEEGRRVDRIYENIIDLRNYFNRLMIAYDLFLLYTTLRRNYEGELYNLGLSKQTIEIKSVWTSRGGKKNPAQRYMNDGIRMHKLTYWGNEAPIYESVRGATLPDHDVFHVKPGSIVYPEVVKAQEKWDEIMREGEELERKEHRDEERELYNEYEMEMGRQAEEEAQYEY